MSSEYYFEIRRRKSFELEQNYEVNPSLAVEEADEEEGDEEKVESDNNASSIVGGFGGNVVDSFLHDYEIVNNEECTEEEQANDNDENIGESTGELKNPANEWKFSACDGDGKLHVDLSAKKIALKASTLTRTTTKIYKSIRKESETEEFSKKLHKTRTRPNHPTIEGEDEATTATPPPVPPPQPPVPSSQRFNAKGVNAWKEDSRGHDRQPQSSPVAFTIMPINVEKSDNNGHNNDNPLPEIVLTSFSAKKKPSLTRDMPQSPRQATPAILPPPPPEIGRLNSVRVRPKFPTKVKILAEAEVHERHARRQLPAREEDDENAGGSSGSAGEAAGNSSTSPESLMDNILSAASSVSVRSSSLSSASTIADIPQTDVDHRSQTERSRNERRNNNNKIVTIVAAPTIPATATRITRNVNRSLKLKPPEMSGAAEAPPSIVPSPTVVGMLATPTPEPQMLQPPPQQTNVQPCEANANRVRNRSRSPSPSRIRLIVTGDSSAYPEELKCSMCSAVFRDPRTLNCLHSFCFQCLVDEYFKEDTTTPFWAQPPTGIGGETSEWKAFHKSNYSLQPSLSPETTGRSSADAVPLSPTRQRLSSFSFKRKKSLERILLKTKSDGKVMESSQSLRMNCPAEDRARVIACRKCQYPTELPIGGIRQLPQNFVITRKIDEIKSKMGEDVLAKIWCNLCFDEMSATYHCMSCTLNLCTLCKEAHERQRPTANHKIRNIMDVRRNRKMQKYALEDNARFTLKCGMHPEFDMKTFCASCLQIACPDCLVLLHKGHRHETIPRAVGYYVKVLRDSAEQTRPLCSYAEHSIQRLNEIAKEINAKCDDIQCEVEKFLKQYFEALEAHKRTLMQQVTRARESKVEMILEQQMDLEKRTVEAKDAVRFCQELTDIASDVEVLSFVNILLKRFEYCQQFKAPTDPKISDNLHFLPKLRAPSTRDQNDIPLYGIITMQNVEPSLCSLQWDGFSHLRLHKKVNFTVQTRDADGATLCHGGLQIVAQIKYKEHNAKLLPVEISDNRDGTYNVSFTPDSQGTVILTISINDKPIKGSPFSFPARTVRPHNGIYHCCAFCSSKGNKLVKCYCEGRMPGYNGCGHGHAGHPGRRHWSCCGNVLENSECTMANKMLSS